MKEETYINLLWWEICLTFPIFLTLSLISGIALFINCGDGHQWSAHIIMVIYSIAVISIETSIFIKRPEKWLPPPMSTKPGIKCLKAKSIMNSELFIWSFQLAITFFAYMDLYTDLCFIVIAQSTNRNTPIWISALILLIITCLPKIISYIWIFKLKLWDKKWEMEYGFWGPKLVCNILEMKCSLHLLNSVHFHRSLDNKYKIGANLWKFFTEDLGQFILQFIYVIKSEEYCGDGGTNLIIYASLFISAFMASYSVVSPILARICISALIKHAFSIRSRSVNLDGSGLGNGGAHLVAEILKTNNYVQELYLSMPFCIYIYIYRE